MCHEMGHGSMTMKDESRRMWDTIVAANFEMHLPEGSEENHKCVS